MPLLLLLLPVTIAADPQPLPPVRAVPADARCDVEVTSDGPGEGFRGTPNTPAIAAARAALSPEEQAMWDAEDHGTTYHQCTWTVTIAGKRYRWTDTVDTTLAPVPAGWCAARVPGVAADVQITTRGCTDLHRGAYTGHDLVPLDDKEAK